MAYATTLETRLLQALDSLLALTTAESMADQQTDARLREEFRAARESAEHIADSARQLRRIWP